MDGEGHEWTRKGREESDVANRVIIFYKKHMLMKNSKLGAQ